MRKRLSEYNTVKGRQIFCEESWLICWCLLLCSCRKSPLRSSPSFIVSVLHNLSALPDFKHWMVENLASLCLEGDIGRGFLLIHCIFFPFFFCLCWKHNNCVYFAPLAVQPSEMQPVPGSKPRSVLKPPQNPRCPAQCRKTVPKNQILDDIIIHLVIQAQIVTVDGPAECPSIQQGFYYLCRGRRI